MFGDTFEEVHGRAIGILRIPNDVSAVRPLLEQL
jgi:hypothetical protein